MLTTHHFHVQVLRGDCDAASCYDLLAPPVNSHQEKNRLCLVSVNKGYLNLDVGKHLQLSQLQMFLQVCIIKLVKI